MNAGLERFTKLINGSLDYLSISILIAAAVILSTDGWRKGRSFFFAAAITGTVFGYVADQTPYISDFSYLAAVIGTITGPATLAVFRHKTIVDLYDLAKSRVTQKKNKPHDDASDNS